MACSFRVTLTVSDSSFGEGKAGADIARQLHGLANAIEGMNLKNKLMRDWVILDKDGTETGHAVFSAFVE